MKILKRQCDNILQDTNLSLDDKEKQLKEKIETTLLSVRSIQGQFTSSLQLSKQLVTNFSIVVTNYFHDIDVGIKSSNPNFLRFTRAELGPGILTKYLDEFWDLIPSSLTNLGLLNLSDAVQVQESQFTEVSDLVHSLNDKVRTIEEELKMPCKTVLAKVF